MRYWGHWGSLGGGTRVCQGTGLRVPSEAPPPRSSLFPQVANHVVQALLNQKVGGWGGVRRAGGGVLEELG